MKHSSLKMENAHETGGKNGCVFFLFVCPAAGYSFKERCWWKDEILWGSLWPIDAQLLILFSWNYCVINGTLLNDESIRYFWCAFTNHNTYHWFGRHSNILLSTLFITLLNVNPYINPYIWEPKPAGKWRSWNLRIPQFLFIGYPN